MIGCLGQSHKSCRVFISVSFALPPSLFRWVATLSLGGALRVMVVSRCKTTHPWGGASDTDTNTDTDHYGHASLVMGHASSTQPYGLRFSRTRLSTLSIPFVPYVQGVLMVKP